MKVRIEKVFQGNRKVTVVPGPRSMLPPVQVQGTDKSAVLSEVDTIVREVRRKAGLRDDEIIEL